MIDSLTSERPATADPVAAALTAPGAPFEMVEDVVRGRRVKIFRHGPRTIGDVYRSATRFADAEFLASLDYRMSYREVFARAAALGQRLAGQGFGRGDRIAISMHNRAEWVIAFIAVTAIGATAVLMNYRFSGPELNLALEETDCAALIAEPQIAQLADPAWREQHIVLVTDDDLPEGTSRMADAMSGWESSTLAPVDMVPDDEAVVIFTSGTTGNSKGALISQRALMTSIMNIDFSMIYGMAGLGLDLAAFANRTEQTTAALVFPLFHTAGIVAVLLPAMRKGGKVAMLRRWKVPDVLELVRRENVSGFSGSPAMVWDLLNAADDGMDLSPIKFLSVGGQATPPRLLSEIRQAMPGIALGTGYGQSETGSVTSIGGRDIFERSSSCGRPLPSIEIRIIRDDGEPADVNEPGEVCISGATLMEGYCARPRETAETLVDGWVHTGDIGRLDEDGFLHIVDRKKNMVISGGENIGCAEVENAATTHPEVLEAAAFGIPDERLGECLVLAAVRSRGSAVAAEAVQAHIATRLAIYKTPRAVIFLDQLPVNALGKVDRRALAQLMTGDAKA